MSLSLGSGPAVPPGRRGEPAPPADGERGRGPWLTVAVVLVLVAAALLANVVRRAGPADPATAAPPAASSPQARNAVVFLVDDMSDFSCAEAALYLPRSSPWLLERGTCYDEATTSTPVCCPARAQVQTGQLSHNNRVISQEAARSLVPEDTIQHDLGRAGFATYGIGKNLNGVRADEYVGPDALDPGFEDFDFWSSYRYAPGTFQRYDDRGRRYTPTDGLTQTETHARLLEEFLDRTLASGERFYVYDAFVTPHKQGVGYTEDDLPLPSAAHADAPLPPFRFAPEPQADDKLPIFRGAHFPRSWYERLFAAKVRSLLDVDDAMAAAFERLEEAGVLDETAVVFTSDNGYTDRGQANWEGKAIPYPASTDVPMLAWYPGRAAAVEPRPVALVDVAATLYDVLGVTPGHQLDGHSMVGGHVREHVFAEFYNETSGLARRESGPRASNLRSWRLVRRGDEAYVEWYGAGGVTVFAEYYADREMLRNLLSPVHADERPPPSTVREMQELLRRYGTCQGTVENGNAQPCP